MNEVTNEQVCKTITRMIERHPSLRVMQLVSNCIPPDVNERLSGDLYYLDDEELLGYLLEYERDTLNKGEI